MWRMLQAAEPADYVLATGRGWAVRDLVETAFAYAGLDWRAHVRHDERYLRPSEVVSLVGDAGAAGRELGWTASVHAPELVRIMVDADIAALDGES
jgi:GDPmannose 4,6-dehydratase